MIDDLLEYARAGRQGERVEEVDPEQLVRETLDLLNIPAHFRVEVEITARPFPATRTPLSLAIRNLLSNACKHHGGSKGVIRISVEEEGRFNLFTVEDDGVGVPPGSEERIFKLFHRASSQAAGHGVGLAVTRRMVNSNGGTVVLDRNGSLAVPVSVSAGHGFRSGGGVMTNAILSSDITVLLVDDDDVAIEGVLRGVRRQGLECKMETACDGLEALQILRGTHESKSITSPFLILLDLNMPRMDGFQFLEAVRADNQLRNSVIFVLTTSARDADRMRAYEENVAGYMMKSAVGPQFVKLMALLHSYAQSVVLPTR